MIDEEMKKRAHAKPHSGEPGRKDLQKLLQKITDIVDHKVAGVKATDTEYWGLADILTDEMVAVALKMKLRAHYTVPELWKMNNIKTEAEKTKFQKLLDDMAFIGLLEYDYGYHYDHNGRTAPHPSGGICCPCSSPAPPSC